MKIAKDTVWDTFAGELDMATIRRRVARIKSQWTPEVARARAVEGARRRRELDTLVSQLWTKSGDQPSEEGFPCRDTHGLTLVG